MSELSDKCSDIWYALDLLEKSKGKQLNKRQLKAIEAAKKKTQQLSAAVSKIRNLGV